MSRKDVVEVDTVVGSLQIDLDHLLSEMDNSQLEYLAEALTSIVNEGFFINAIGTESLLDQIGKEACCEHFSLVEAEE